MSKTFKKNKSDDWAETSAALPKHSVTKRDKKRMERALKTKNHHYFSAEDDEIEEQMFPSEQ